MIRGLEEKFLQAVPLWCTKYFHVSIEFIGPLEKISNCLHRSTELKPWLKSRSFTQNPAVKGFSFSLAFWFKQVKQEKRKVSGSIMTVPKSRKSQWQSLH